jgi:hypothetical protein
VKYSGNDFDTGGLKAFGQQPVPTCPAKGGKRVNARARERRDMSVPSKNPKFSRDIRKLEISCFRNSGNAGFVTAEVSREASEARMGHMSRRDPFSF